MSVRVFDGEQPGYAILVFDKPVDSPSLRLAIRSRQVHQGAFVGPGGSWGKTPHYFDAERAQAENGEAGYRVGPEVVNHLLEYDLIEARSEDGSLCEEGVWENAVPAMLPGGGTIIAAPPRIMPDESPPVRPPPPIPSSPPPPPPPSPPPPPVGDEGAAQSGPREAPPLPRVASRKFPLWIAFAGVAALAAVIVMAPSLRCGALGLGCPSDETPEQAKAREARECADKKQAAGDYCALEQACLAPYRTLFPEGAAVAEFGGIALRAKDQCDKSRDRVPAQDRAAEERAAQERAAQERTAHERALAEARKCAAANPCVVLDACFRDYLRSYGEGPGGVEARSEIERARQACPSPQPGPGPRPGEQTALPDGEYSARATPGCGAKRQSVIVIVRAGRINWTHRAPLSANANPIDVPWSGAIDRNGAIAASFGNSPEYVASGRYAGDEREVSMRYPQCAAPVVMTIGNPISR